MSIGNKIKHYRKGKGLSQEELAEEVGISRQAVSKWESGKSLPSTDNLIYLSEILNVSVGELTSINEEYKDEWFDKRGFQVAYSLSGAAAMFYYGFTNIDLVLRIAYVVLGFVGVVMLSVFTYKLYNKKTRTKVLSFNLIYLILINTLGILSKYYGGVIASILILLIILGYEKFLKSRNL